MVYQESHSSRAQCLLWRFLVVVRRNEDNWDSAVCGGQLSLQLQATHSGQPHVKDEASRVTRSWSGSRWVSVAGHVLLPCLTLQTTPSLMTCLLVTTLLGATATPLPVATTEPLSLRASTTNTEGDKRLKSSCGEGAAVV